MIKKIINGVEEPVANSFDSDVIQTKELSTPITINGVQQTLVEGAIGALNTVDGTKAKQTDISSIVTTGATNTTGATITKGSYFYLNGTLVRAKTDIANGASYTSGTNYEAVMVGDQLTVINSNLTQNVNLLTPNATYVTNNHVYSIDIGGFLVVQGYCTISAEVPANITLFTLSSAISKKFITGVYQYFSSMRTDGAVYKLGSTQNSNTMSVTDNPMPAGGYTFFGILAVQ